MGVMLCGVMYFISVFLTVSDMWYLFDACWFIDLL